MTLDYHAPQMTGSPCQGRNCAAASGAMSVAAGSGGKIRLTADQYRAASNVSCIPKAHSPSGGLYISDVIRTDARYGVTIDYGRDPVSFYERWGPSVAKSRLATNWGMVALGDYDQMRPPFEASGTFLGDHSAWAHDYRTDLTPYPGGPHDAAPTVCFHDPLRTKPIRLPWTEFVRYWQKPSSPIRGFAGFVRLPAPPKPPTAWGPDVPAAIRATNPDGRKVLAKVKATGHKPGDIVNMDDLQKALDRIGHDWGTVVDPADVRVLLAWAK